MDHVINIPMFKLYWVINIIYINLLTNAS
jgi:hypothetical protein